MSKGIGRLVQIGVKKEATRGTAESSATYWLPWTDLTLDEKKEFATDEQAYGVIEDNAGLTEVKKWVEGSIAGNVGDTTFGLLLDSHFGSHSVSGSNPYTHSFPVDQSAQHQSLTFFVHDPIAGRDYSHANGIVSKLDLTAELQKFLAYTATIMAQSSEAQSDFSPAVTTENRFVPQYLAAKFALDKAGLDGTKTVTGDLDGSTAVITNISDTTKLKVGMSVTGTGVASSSVIVSIDSSSQITLDKDTTASGTGTTLTIGPVVIALKSVKVTSDANIESQDVLGSLSPADFNYKEFSVQGTLEAIWQNESDFKTNFMAAGTPIAIELDFVNTDVSLSGGSNPELIHPMPKCTITELGRPFKTGNLVYQTISFRCSYSLADTIMITPKLINSTATY